MQRRQWDAKTNAMIVIEGLKGKPSTINGVTSFWPTRPKPLRSMSKASVKRVSPGRTPSSKRSWES